jgi:hypothetical protein
MLKANKTRLERFVAAYIEAALFSSTDHNDEPLDAGNYELADETIQKMQADCLRFWCANEDDIGDDIEHAGHDFWLTRCGHGAGFWDGDWAEPAATILDNAAKAYGNVDLYVGDDGQIYAM